MPKKQVILRLDEYDKFIQISATLAKIVDKYVEENPSDETGCIIDSEKCDPDMYTAYSLLLHLDGIILHDIQEKIPSEYFEKFAHSVIKDFDTGF